MSNDLGFIKGEICNRDGCIGVIDETPKEGSCSCHIHPPCGYCTTDTSYCPVCDWHPEDDRMLIDPETEKRNREYYEREMAIFTERRERFYKKFRGDEPIEKLEIRTEAHTHFTQKQIGVFPPGTETPTSLLPKINGTFGGRYESFNPKRGTFSFIAYTD